MKPGVRALGVAESFADGDERSVLCGAVVRADRTADGFVFGSCAVGGTDATAAIESLYADLSANLRAAEWERAAFLTTRPDLLELPVEREIDVRLGRIEASVVLARR
jgi:hypothetical protein